MSDHTWSVIGQVLTAGSGIGALFAAFFAGRAARASERSLLVAERTASASERSTAVAERAASASELATTTAERSVESSERTSRAELMLAFDARLDAFGDVHLKLRPGNDWKWNGGGPKSPEEWVPVELYMGTFERMYYHKLRGDFDLDYIDMFFGYRLRNLVSNNAVRRDKLRDRKNEWKMFLDLMHALAEHRSKEDICEYCIGNKPRDSWLQDCRKDLYNG